MFKVNFAVIDDQTSQIATELSIEGRLASTAEEVRWICRCQLIFAELVGTLRDFGLELTNVKEHSFKAAEGGFKEGRIRWVEHGRRRKDE